VSPNEDLRLTNQQKSLSQWLRSNLQKDLSDEYYLNQQQELPIDSPVLNQDLQRPFTVQHQDKQLLDIQEEGQGSQEEYDTRFQNNIALEQAEAESTRSYNYEDRGLGLNKLEMLTNWLSKCQQKNANSDDQDSLRGEVDIGDERQIILTEDDLIMNKIEDAPSITLQDPEEVIQRGQEVSHTFLQEIQNAMEIVSNTSSQGEGERDNLLPEHIAIQDEDNGILLCKRCHKSFVFDDCKKHIKCKEKKSTSVGKLYECTFCDKKCQSSSHLKYHIRSAHTGERPYKCTLCSMSFLQIVKLKRHILTHTGEKPYQCDICNVCFRTGYHLKEHRNIHTKLTHHSCDICSRSFADSSNLRRHMKNLHGQKSAACKFCGQNFPTKHDLMIHKAKVRNDLYTVFPLIFINLKYYYIYE
jgi:stress-induced morphogen